ncbi:MAG: DNA recombination protein RmuC [Proteobacteria bacterium]|jgi:DNA recombination protein RmuC|nr:DNA recombination protein RmuC [Pseudomonadota bacterium]
MELVIFAFGAVVGLVIGYVLSQKKFQSTQAQLEKVMEQRFENLANRILNDNSQKFSDQSFKHLNHLIEPFKERLKDFEKKVEESYSTERAERGSLRGELTRLMELNSKMSQEAESLSRALKGDNKTMGNWGEMILENILERSGLRKNEEYIVQGTELSLKNDDGQSIRPDVLVKLPDGKHLIIDSKVSLTAYESYVNAETEAEREVAAKAHVESLKRHIDGLSAKKYHTAQGLASPDFVMLFMPIEPAFALAFKLKPDLLQMAWDKNIALVSPTTLLSTLRTVAATWKHERQERNALEIAKQGGALYDKFVGFVDDLTELGKKIEQTQKAHHQVMNKLSEGSGNLIRRVENLKELGVKTDKRLMLDQ